MTTARIYKSTDASAPVLSGTVGSLVALLDACLVNGYGSQTAAGWTKPFSGTNKAVYRNNSTSGTGFYMNVDDSGAGAGAHEAFITGFQTMSAIATGTGMFPASNLIVLGSSPTSSLVWRKSNATNSTSRSWVLAADETVMYLFVETGDYTVSTGVYGYMFGDIVSYAQTDPYRCMIIGNNSSNADWQRSVFTQCVGFPWHGCSGHVMAADWTGLNASLQVGKQIDSVKMGFGGTGNGTGFASTAQNNFQLFMGNMDNAPQNLPFPNNVDGSMLMSPIWICHGYKIRGYLKGIWAPLHHLPLQHGETFSGTNSLAGKTFLSQWFASGPTQNNWYQTRSCAMIETSNTWS